MLLTPEKTWSGLELSLQVTDCGLSKYEDGDHFCVVKVLKTHNCLNEERLCVSEV